MSFDDKFINGLVVVAIWLTSAFLGAMLFILGIVVAWTGYSQEKEVAVLAFGGAFALVGGGFAILSIITLYQKVSRRALVPNYPEYRPLDRMSVGRTIASVIFTCVGLSLFYPALTSENINFLILPIPLIFLAFGILNILGVTSAATVD